MSENCLVHALTGRIFGGKHLPILFYSITIFADLKSTVRQRQECRWVLTPGSEIDELNNLQ